jgi:hypothetical protein
MSAFRLLSGTTAPHAKPAGASVEIVFVGIRLCDRLICAQIGILTHALSALPAIVVQPFLSFW